MKKKYTAWGILMIVFGALGVSLGIFLCVCLAICMSDVGIQNYISLMAQMDYFSMTKSELQILLVTYFVLVGLFTLVQAFVQFHGAVRLMKKKAKGKGWFITYGVESIIAAIIYFMLTISSFSGLFMVQGVTAAQMAGVTVVMICMVFIFVILTVYKIVTACMMFSKMGNVVIVKKETKQQLDMASLETVASTEGQPVRQGEIVLLNGEYENHSFHVKEGETIVIGSDATVSNLTLHDEKVSKKHCTVTYHADSDMFHLTDVSETGTIINGVMIDSEVTYSLPKGSIIILGDSIKLQTK